MDFKLRSSVTQRSSKIHLLKVPPRRKLQTCQTSGKAQVHPVPTRASSELQPPTLL